MSNNQYEDSEESEYELSSDDDTASEGSTEDEAEILARLRSQKNEVVVEIDTAEEGTDTQMVGEENEVLQYDESGSLTLDEDTRGDIFDDVPYISHISASICENLPGEDDIHDESVDLEAEKNTADDLPLNDTAAPVMCEVAQEVEDRSTPVYTLEGKDSVLTADEIVDDTVNVNLHEADPGSGDDFIREQYDDTPCAEEEAVTQEDTRSELLFLRGEVTGEGAASPRDMTTTECDKVDKDQAQYFSSLGGSKGATQFLVDAQRAEEQKLRGGSGEDGVTASEGSGGGSNKHELADNGKSDDVSSGEHLPKKDSGEEVGLDKNDEDDYSEDEERDVSEERVFSGGEGRQGSGEKGMAALTGGEDPQPGDSTAEMVAQQELILTMGADIEQLKLKLEQSAREKAELTLTAVRLEDYMTLALRDAEDKFSAELSEVRKQHATAEQTISAKHRLEILREAADSTRQRLESEAAISELNVKLIAAEGSIVELDAFSQKEPQRQAEAIRLALANAEQTKRARTSAATQTESSAHEGSGDGQVEDQAQMAALEETNESLRDDVDGLNYKIEELECELASVTEKWAAAATENKNILSSVVNHDDRANLLQFKLKAANDEVDRSNKECEDWRDQFKCSQAELQQSARLVQELQARVKTATRSKQDLANQLTDYNYEVQLLKEEVSTLKAKAAAALLEEASALSSPEKATTSTAEPGHHVGDSENTERLELPYSGEDELKIPHRERHGGGMKKAAAKKLSRKSLVSVSASQPVLPVLVSTREMPRKKKAKKAKVLTQLDDHSMSSSAHGGAKRIKKKAKLCCECACRIKGEARVLPCELKTDFKRLEESDLSAARHSDQSAASSILDHQFMFRDKYGHRRGEEALFCSWVCARAWSGKHTPLQHRRTTRQLINLADGYDKES